MTSINLPVVQAMPYWLQLHAVGHGAPWIYSSDNYYSSSSWENYSYSIMARDRNHIYYVVIPDDYLPVLPVCTVVLYCTTTGWMDERNNTLTSPQTPPGCAIMQLATHSRAMKKTHCGAGLSIIVEEEDGVVLLLCPRWLVGGLAPVTFVLLVVFCILLYCCDICTPLLYY